MSYADLVEILATYSIVHEAPGHYLEDSYYGWTDRKKHTIHILAGGDASDAKDTILHEALHVQCYKLMRACSEGDIEMKSQAIYKALFVAPVTEAK